MKPLEDTDIITFGIHKGKMLANIPAEYFIWLHENNKAFGTLKQYITENMDCFKKEIKERKYQRKEY